MAKKEYRLTFAEVRKWVRLLLPWIILGIGGFFAFRKIKEYKNKQVETVIVEKKVVLEVPGPIRWRDKLVWRDVPPDTIYIDTIVYVPLYERPWGIIKLEKIERKLSMTAFRPTKKDPSMINYKKYMWSLRIGKTFKILPTDKANDPFILRENKDYIDFRFGGGLSAIDKVYLTSGIYLQGIKFKRIQGDIGLSSYVSFFRQDIRLEFVF